MMMMMIIIMMVLMMDKCMIISMVIDDDKSDGIDDSDEYEDKFGDNIIIQYIYKHKYDDR